MIHKQSMYKIHAKLNEDTQVGVLYKEGIVSAFVNWFIRDTGREQER